jgi:putative colanic acid biosynthesis acetyltransferase WcaF
MSATGARLTTMPQASAYHSPWPLRVRLAVGLWALVWLFLFRPTPKPLTRWRLFLLRCFGARVTGRPFVDASVIVKMPWHLVLEDRATVGVRCEIYNLGPITLRERCTVAQQAYLCAGTHDFSLPNLPLVVGPIEVGADAFVCARAFVLPGVMIGEGAIVGACSVVTKDVAPWTVVAGNPARPVGHRAWARADREPATSPVTPFEEMRR